MGSFIDDEDALGMLAMSENWSRERYEKALLEIRKDSKKAEDAVSWFLIFCAVLLFGGELLCFCLCSQISGIMAFIGTILTILGIARLLTCN